jgi:hypothetical protein
MVISRLNLNGELHQQKKQNGIDAIVSRSGRLNRTDQHLNQVHEPSFLNMGRNPLHVSGMNQEAFERLKTKDKRLDTVSEPHITFFLLEEPVKLEEAERLPVRDYFERYLLT